MQEKTQEESNYTRLITEEQITPQTNQLTQTKQNQEQNQELNLLEAALLCSPEPISIKELAPIFDPPQSPAKITALLRQLQKNWETKSLELIQTASGWRFQSRAEIRDKLTQIKPEKPPKYSRAAMETLAIIAYRQPVTRGDIENIRGVAVASQIIAAFEERGWIEQVGHRQTIGRPALYATTRTFLDDLGVCSLQELPPLPEIAKTLQSPEQALEIPAEQETQEPNQTQENQTK